MGSIKNNLSVYFLILTPCEYPHVAQEKNLQVIHWKRLRILDVGAYMYHVNDIKGKEMQ